jgi:hypothetical protein
MEDSTIEEDVRRSSEGVVPSPFGFGVLFGFFPPSCVLVGTVDVVEVGVSGSVSSEAGCDASPWFSSGIFLFLFLTTWFDTVAPCNRGILHALLLGLLGMGVNKVGDVNDAPGECATRTLHISSFSQSPLESINLDPRRHEVYIFIQQARESFETRFST